MAPHRRRRAIPGRHALPFAARATLLAAVITATAAAASAQASATGTVRGVVFDSLLHAPLAGAFVTVSGSAVSGFSDQTGSYVLRDVPAGRQMIEFTHPALDSAGVGGSSAAVQVAAGGTTVATLATPSFERLWKAACGDAPALPKAGLVFGSVRDAEREERLEGAAVVITWLEFGAGADGKLGSFTATLRADSDSTGTYYACGVPAETGVAATAYAARGATGELELAVGPRRILRRDFAVSRETAADAGAPAAKAGRDAAPDTSVRLRRGLATLVGTVRDESGKPLADALASVAGAPGETRSDASGRFVLRGLPSGTQMLEVRLLGFGAARLPVELRNRDSATVDVGLVKATILGAVNVRAPRAARALLEMDERQKSGLGRFITEKDLAGKHSIRSVFEEVPSVTVQTANRGTDFTILLPAASLGGNSKCEANVFIDGTRASVQELTAMKPEDLLAVEVYVRASQVPSKYQYVAERCGVVLAWTRYMR